MSIRTYAELQTAAGNWLNRSDLTSRLPEFVALAESRFNRILNTPEMEAVATLSTTGESVALPADFWEARGAYLDSDPRVVIEEVSLAYLRDRYSAQTTGQPQVYAVSGANLVLGPAPDTTYSLKLTYKQTIPALSDSNTTNWLLTRHPDIYLYGTLLQAEAYGWNDERLGLWKAALDEAIAELQKAGQRKRYGAAPIRLRSPVAWGG